MSEMDQRKDVPIRQALGRLIGVLIIAGAVVVSLLAVWEWQVNPETDDATVRANFIGVAPQVNGHIVELPVRDQQRVQAGDLLFVIDPRPYEIAVEQARAALEAARAQHSAAVAAHEQSKSEQGRAQDAIGQDGELNARIRAAEAAVNSAELNLSYCHVRAPFTGLVVNLNLSVGAFARAGVEVFTLVDTGTWYVIGNFRETQLRHMRQGSAADIYLQSQPNRRFQGTVVGLGWAVLPEYGTSVNGLPQIPRQLDWVRLAQRFPVRIRVDNPDDSLRLGASAVVTVHGDTGPEAQTSSRERDR